MPSRSQTHELDGHNRMKCFQEPSNVNPAVVSVDGRQSEAFSFNRNELRDRNSAAEVEVEFDIVERVLTPVMQQNLVKSVPGQSSH